MTKCEIFLKYFDSLNGNGELPKEVQEFYDILRNQDSSSGEQAFTEMGLSILEYLQQNASESRGMKAKEIADGMVLPSRKVSGAMRKLVADGYVEKIGSNPVIYILSETGKNFDINSVKEN